MFQAECPRQQLGRLGLEKCIEVRRPQVLLEIVKQYRLRGGDRLLGVPHGNTANRQN